MISPIRDIATRRYWKKLGTHTLAVIGVIALLVEFLHIFWPGALTHLSGKLTTVILLSCIGYGISRSWPRPVEQTYTKPTTEIRILEGDLFEREDNLVIGMTTTFDTATPNIIQVDGIQGQFLSRIYNGDLPELDQQLDAALQGSQAVGVIQKSGKTRVFPVGTVAVLRNLRRHYFCVAYAEMNQNNRAQADIDGIWKSLCNLWDSIRDNTNGAGVAIPVIGGGLSRISSVLPAQDSIRLIALSFMFASRKNPVCSRLDIVVRPQEATQLDMLELQAFLKSLKES